MVKKKIYPYTIDEYDKNLRIALSCIEDLSKEISRLKFLAMEKIMENIALKIKMT